MFAVRSRQPVLLLLLLSSWPICADRSDRKVQKQRHRIDGENGRLELSEKQRRHHLDGEDGGRLELFDAASITGRSAVEANATARASAIGHRSVTMGSAATDVRGVRVLGSGMLHRQHSASSIGSSSNSSGGATTRRGNDRNRTPDNDEELKASIAIEGQKFQAKEHMEETEERSLGNGTNELREAREETKLAKEEETSLLGGLSMIARASTDPRGFLLQLPGIDRFVTGLRVAVHLSPDKGYCLQKGEFEGFGCIDDGKNPQICQCKQMLQFCWVEDEHKVMDAYTSGNMTQAIDDAKSLLFGRCYVPLFVKMLVGAGGLLVLVLITVVAKSMGKKGGDDSIILSGWAGLPQHNDGLAEAVMGGASLKPSLKQ